MRTGIITALESEAATFPTHGGRLLGLHEFVVKVAGPGQHQAARAAAELIDAGCEVLLSWGLAGGLNPRLHPGALLVATAVVTDDGREVPCDEIWQTGLLAKLAPLEAMPGRLHSAPLPIAAAAAKSTLFSTHRADAVDMESAAIAGVAQACAARFAVVRCVVDPVGFTIPQAALKSMGPDGRTHALATAVHVLAHPRELAPLLRLAGWYRTALATLARAARMLCCQPGG